MAREINPSLVDITYLYDQKLIGFSEARNLLEQVFPGFVEARDKELDQLVTDAEQSTDLKMLPSGEEPPDLP